MLKRVVILGIVMIFCVITGITAAENLAKNPGFEAGSGDVPQNWFTEKWKKKDGVTEFTWQSGDAHSGKRCFKIVNTETNDARLMQEISIEPNKKYKISCGAKEKNKGPEGVGANISLRGKLDTSNPLDPANQDWQNLTLYVQTLANVSEFTVSVGLGAYGNIATGEVWLDDVVIEEVNEIPPGVKIATVRPEEEKTTSTTQKDTTQKQSTPTQPEEPKKATNWGLIILIVLLGAVVLVLLIVIAMKKDKKKEGTEDTPDEEPTPEEGTEEQTSSSPEETAASSDDDAKA